MHIEYSPQGTHLARICHEISNTHFIHGSDFRFTIEVEKVKSFQSYVWNKNCFSKAKEGVFCDIVKPTQSWGR